MRLKKGDKVRVLKKTVGQTLDSIPYKLDVETIEYIAGSRKLTGNMIKFKEKDGFYYFEDTDLELIEEENIMKYKVLKPINMTEFIIAHQKDYKWMYFKDACEEFKKDIEYWQKMASFTWSVIVGNITAFRDIKKYYSEDFFRHLVKYGFLEEVKEKKKYYLAIEYPDRPIGEYNTVVVVDEFGKKVCCPYVLNFLKNGLCERITGVNRSVGLSLDKDGAILVESL